MDKLITVGADFDKAKAELFDKINKLFIKTLVINLDFDKLKNLQIASAQKYELENMLAHNEFVDLITTILEECQR